MSEPFDPDAFLADEDEFDPDAFLAGEGGHIASEGAPSGDAPAPAKEKPSAGGLEWSDLGRMNAPTAGMMALKDAYDVVSGDPEKLAKFKAFLQGVSLGGAGKLASAITGKDQGFKEAGDDYSAHNLAGGIALPIPGAGALSKVPGLGAVAASGMKGALARTGATAGIGAALGGVAGALDDDSSALAGAGAGALAGGLGGAIGEGASYIGGKYIEPWLKETSINQARRVLTNGADSLSKRGPVSQEAVREALDSGAITAFGNTKGTFNRLDELAAAEGEKYAGIVAKLEEMGVTGPRADDLAKEMLAKAKELAPNTMNEALPAAWEDAAKQVITKRGANNELGLMQAENLKRSLQNKARYGQVHETELNEVNREIASTFRQANEDAIGRYAENATNGGPGGIQEVAAQFRPAKEKVGNLIEAREAARRGMARGAQRNAISIGDKMAGMAAAASGAGPLGSMAVGGASNFLNNRGASAVAVGAKSLSQSELIKGIVTRTPMLLGPFGPYLAKVLAEKGDEGFAVADYVMHQQDPRYREAKEKALAEASE